MEEHIDKLARLLVRIRTPLSLAGLAFVVLYLIYRQVLGLDVFARLDQEATFRILNQVIGSLFWLAMVALILGVLASFSLVNALAGTSSGSASRSIARGRSRRIRCGWI